METENSDGSTVIVVPPPVLENGNETVGEAIAVGEIAHAEARIAVAEIEASRDIAIAEIVSETTVQVNETTRTNEEQIAWLTERVVAQEEELRSCLTLISDLTQIKSEPDPEALTVETVTEALDPETGTTLTQQSTLTATGETLTEAIAESASEEGLSETTPSERVRRRRVLI